MLGMSFRAEWRRRWGSLFVLALIIALATGVVLTALAAARRTSSVPERFSAEAELGDGSVTLSRDDPALRASLAELPSVEIAAPVAFMGALPTRSDVFLPLLAPLDDAFGNEYERGILVQGRRADPTRPNEIALSEGQARLLPAEVGDRVEYAAFPPEVFERCLAGEDDAPPDCAEVFAHPSHVIALDVVGIVRSGEDVSGVATDFAVSVTTPAFYEKYHGVIGEDANLVSVRLREGVTTEEFAREVRAALGDDVDYLEFDSGSALTDSSHVLALGLLVFGLVVLVAGAVAVGQAILRHIQAVLAESDTLGALGASRLARAVATVVPLVPVTVVGVGIGGVAAAIASRWFPRGVARRAEPDLGVDIDPFVLFGGALALVLAMLGLAAFAAWFRTRRDLLEGTREHHWLRRHLRTLRPPALGIGVGMAIDPGRGRRAVPVRSALVAFTAAIAGVGAVVAYGAGLERLQHTPALYGDDYDAAGFRDGDALIADPDVDAVAQVAFRIPLRIDERPIPGFAFRSLKGDIGPSIVRGRAPQAEGEVALGADTLAQAGAAIGDTVRVTGDGGVADLRVVGTAVFPIIDNSNAIADGIAVTPNTARTIGGESSETFDNYVIRVADGVDKDAVIDRLAARESDSDGGVTVPTPPGEIENLDQIDTYPVALAVVLAILGAVGLAHALALAARRRAPDLALLRALGFRPSDVRAAIGWQSLTTAAIGMALGVPFGLLIGRVSWKATADSIGVRVVHVMPVVSLFAAVPVAVIIALTAAWLPARRAARLRPADILRSE